MSDFIENEFRKKASYLVEDGVMRFEDAEAKLEKAKPDNNQYSRFTPQKLLDSAGENFAFASEFILKSNLVYDDFKHNKRFNQTDQSTLQFQNRTILCPRVGSSEWHQAIGGYIDELNVISQPKTILRDIILENNPNDERRNLNNSPQFNSQFKSLTLNGKKPNGHSLYAFYQLQSPIAKSLINAEYYCYVEDEIKYTIFALLTEDILKNDNNGKTIMPKEFMEKLDELKEASVDLRYASMSLNNITPENLTFLKIFSSSLINIGQFRFPIPKEYEQIDFSQYNYNNFIANGFSLFDNLDSLQKYYLQKNFSKEEINSLINYLNLSNLNTIDTNIFIYNCIYFKNYVNNIMQINLKFTEKQFGRIDNLCKLLKAFQPFDEKSKKLCDNEAFATDEKRQIYIEQIKKLKIINDISLNSVLTNVSDNIETIHNKYDGFESYTGTIKKDGKVVEEKCFIVYDDIHDKFLTYFRKDNNMIKPSSLGATFALATNQNNFSPKEIETLEKIISEESLPYGYNLEGYYIDEDTIISVSTSITKGKSR